jgi:autotransporter-associated beta strand protein
MTNSVMITVLTFMREDMRFILTGASSYSGRLGGPGSHENRLALTKTGSGTFTLTGARTYTGSTLVESGTLALVAGSHASPLTVNAGAFLGFTLGLPVTSTAAVNLTAGAVKLTGTVNNATNYKLMTASSFTGSFVLSPAIPGYKLELQGAGNTELWLVLDNSYNLWSRVGLPFDADTNNDGLHNGHAWFLGEPSPHQNAIARLPKVTINAAALVLEFDCLNATAHGNAVLQAQSAPSLLESCTSSSKIPNPLAVCSRSLPPSPYRGHRRPSYTSR